MESITSKNNAVTCYQTLGEVSQLFRLEKLLKTHKNFQKLELFNFFKCNFLCC